MKVIRIHKRVCKELEKLDFSLKRQLTELLGLLAEGENLGMPISRPMSIVERGVYELRIKDRSGQYRVFYYIKKTDVIFVFHFYKKKTQEVPLQEVETAKNRLKEML